MNLLTKAALGVTLAGGLTLGALVTFDGTDTLKSAESKIAQQSNNLNIFADREAQMAGKINGIKGQVTGLKAEVAQLKKDLETAKAQTVADAATIQKLNDEIYQKNLTISDYENQIADLTSQLNNAGGNNEELTKRIADLEGEVKKANTAAADLQKALDNSSNKAPMSQEEFDKLMNGESNGGGTTTPPTSEIPEGFTQIEMISQTPRIVENNLTLDKNTDADFVVKNSGSPGWDWTVVVDNGAPQTLKAGAMIKLGKAADLNKKTLTLTKGAKVYKYYLINK